jgi:hypothetical protein
MLKICSDYPPFCCATASHESLQLLTENTPLQQLQNRSYDLPGKACLNTEFIIDMMQ